MPLAEAATPSPGRVLPVLACPFRPFFLATAVYAVVVMAAWLGTWLGGWPLAAGLSPLNWHAHEMLFGVVPAAVAGFLLTAMCNWTGAKPLSGWPLAGLVALWLAGRVAMWSPGLLPGPVVAVADSLFLLAVAAYAGRVLGAAGNRRNLPLVGVLALFWLAGLASHFGMWTGQGDLARQAQQFTLVLIMLLMVVIGGRITPAFTANWLARRGGDRTRVRSRAWVDRASIVFVAALAIVVALGLHPVLAAALAALGAVANALRLAGWAGWRTRSDPLVWVLHLGYFWIVAALALKAAGVWLPGLPESAWLHAAGVGAMGTLIVGVMSRVCLGHTGRALELPAGASAMYWAITAAVVLRLLVALGWTGPAGYGGMLAAAGGAWMLAFALFLFWYTPILIRPRADGKPG